ncbi:hypothetical protein [Erythrobacter sp. AP23]|uniref:hypothetical protein n=1 Tax=Erythrobacter sp. AP23 TaxID=499656 RepID=UPI00076DA0A6|nr:hypothetical protein [Erythrobacter sp. AP23]KWV93884.1 hypothetical protein ASS64_13415 [Erythrobacter sp. AP23]
MHGLSYLAFAAGYRRVSFVFIEDGQIATWQTSKRAATSPDEVADFAREFIDLLVPNFIVMEDVAAGTRKGAQAQALLAAIKSESENSKALLLSLKREKLFRTRYDEAVYLARHHPEFAEKIPKRSFCDREPYHMVLFEALALGHHAMQGGAMLPASKM